MIVYPFADFIEALREKDAALFSRIGHMRPHLFWQEWQKTYPEDFPQGGQSLASRSSVMPRKLSLLERLSAWDKDAPPSNLAEVHRRQRNIRLRRP